LKTRKDGGNEMTGAMQRRAKKKKKRERERERERAGGRAATNSKQLAHSEML
jgi:hypothetical protein